MCSTHHWITSEISWHEILFELLYIVKESRKSCFESTVDGIKKSRKVFCSNFMSFHPFELIFIGWVGDIWEFYWVLRNFEFKPANEIFLQKGKFLTSQKMLFFLGVMSKIEFEQNWRYRYVLYYGQVGGGNETKHFWIRCPLLAE